MYAINLSRFAVGFAAALMMSIATAYIWENIAQGYDLLWVAIIVGVLTLPSTFEGINGEPEEAVQSSLLGYLIALLKLTAASVGVALVVAAVASRFPVTGINFASLKDAIGVVIPSFIVFGILNAFGLRVGYLAKNDVLK